MTLADFTPETAALWVHQEFPKATTKVERLARIASEERKAAMGMTGRFPNADLASVALITALKVAIAAEDTPPTIRQVDVNFRNMGNAKGQEIVVQAHWRAPTDRRDCMGYALPDTAAGRKLVDRLKAAILAGKVFTSPCVRVNKLGETYVHSDVNAFGRHLDADLKKLGF